MKELLKIMETKLKQGEALVLVTVTAASGATPRGAGARMLMGCAGYLGGTIGGGTVEHRAQEIAMEVLRTQSSRSQDFSLTRNDVQELGMICGGEVHVYFQYIPAGDAHTLETVQAALSHYAEGKSFWLVSELNEGGSLSLFTKESAPQWLRPYLQRRPQLAREGERTIYVEQTGSAGRVYIFGAGHISRELEPVLSHLGFRCVVLDDRPEFADPTLFPTAEAVHCVDFSCLDKYVSIGREDYVCILTRGHAFDTVVEAQVLSKHPRYNGMIGSRAKGEAVRKALREEYGYGERDIASIVSPIGLTIGAETPQEIAISIAAQLIAVRAEEK